MKTAANIAIKKQLTQFKRINQQHVEIMQLNDSRVRLSWEIGLRSSKKQTACPGKKVSDNIASWKMAR